jgi:hypothetical protein
MPFKDAPGNTRKKQLKRKPRPQVPHGPGGTMLRPAPKPKPKPRPKRPVVQAPSGDVKSSGGDYGTSQAKQYKKKEARKRKRRLRTDVKDVKSDRDLGVAKTFKQFDRYKKDTAFAQFKGYQYDKDHDRRADARKRLKRTAADSSAASVASSPVLKVLEQTTRPLHAVAAAAREDVKDVKAGRLPIFHGSAKAALKGIQNKDKSTFSDVAKDLGVKNKAVAGALGFVGDVALDPLTGATFGGSTAARSAARSAARKAERQAAKTPAVKASGQAAEAQAVKHGATPKAAKKVRKTAEKTATKRAGAKAGAKAAAGKQTNNGLSVRFYGNEIPGVTRATSAAKRAPRKVVSKTKLDRTRAGAKVDRGQQKVRDAVRSTAAEVNPNITPVGVDRETYQAMRRAARTARAKTQRGDVYAALSAKSFVDRIGEENFQKVLYAIEEGTTKKLPGNLRAEANRWINLNRKRLKNERRAGIKVADVTRESRIKAVGEVPEVTADVGAAQKTLRAAQVARSKAEREHGRQTHKAGVAEGKARVLVGQSDRKLARTKRKSRPEGTRPTKTLARLESERGKLYAMEKGAVVAKSRQAVRDAETALEATKAQARKQRGRQVRKQNALKRAEAAPVDYVKHLRIDLDTPRKAPSGRGPGSVKPEFGKKREGGLLEDENAVNPGRFSEDAGLIEATRASESSRALAKAEMNRALAQVGRKFDKNKDPRAQLGENEAVYKAEGTDLVRVEPEDVKSGKVPSGQLVVLNEKAVERTAGTVQALAERTTPGVVFDKVQGVWKFAATVVNPGYYVRNFAGEAQNAYLKERPDRLLRNAGTSARALREVRRREEAVRKGEKYVPGKHADLIDQAEGVGAIRAGQYGREIGQQLSSESVKRRGKIKGAGALRRVGRARDNVEDIFRLASFKGGLDRGLKPAHAQQRAAKNHFDYGDLSETERKVLRRVMPFYTFSSRNIPLQIKSLVTHPGKFANYQKVREELGKAFGFEEGWEERLPAVEQRAAPLPVKWRGKEFQFSLGPSGLPLTDLNEFPVQLLEDPLNPASYNAVLDEWLTRAASMVSPIFKTPTELHENISFFFRDQLERDTSPLVPAPGWVGAVMPEGFKELTGYTDSYRNKDGTSGPGWRAKADYLINILPGPAQFANRLSRDGSSADQGTGSKVVQYLGPRIRPVEREGVQINKAYDERAKLRKAQSALRQQNHPVNGEEINADNPTPAYTRSLAESRALDAKIKRLQGEKPKTVRKRVKKFDGGSGVPKWDGGGSGVPKWDG